MTGGPVLGPAITVCNRMPLASIHCSSSSISITRNASIKEKEVFIRSLHPLSRYSLGDLSGRRQKTHRPLFIWDNQSFHQNKATFWCVVLTITKNLENQIAKMDLNSIRQIGRASCRERV